jgi:ketosteroid isomerase-like protein
MKNKNPAGEFQKPKFKFQALLQITHKQMSEHNIDIAKKWFDAFNEHDLEGLLALYADDAKHYSPKLKIRQPETNGLVKGKDALRAWWKDAFDRLPQLHYSYTTLTSNEDRVFMEYIRKVPGEDDMLVAEVLEIKDGNIVASRVYHG